MMRVNQAEYDTLHSLFKKSTCRQLSQYFRKVALQKPVTIKYRNESADEILSVLIHVKNELNAIGNNLNQAVHKLHMVDKIPEFRAWILLHENTRQVLETKMSAMKEMMNQIYLKWSQK